MRYKQRIIKHNIDVPKNIPSDTIELNEIKYDPSVISHHPKSFEYYFTHGILINDERYIIKEFYVKNEDVYAVVTKDEITYFELRMNYCSKPVLDKILKDLDKVKNSVENNKPVLTGRTLTINGSSVELPDDTQELSLRDHKLILSKGNSVDLPEYDDSEVKSRLNTLETREDNDKQTLSINERTVSISNGNSIELPEDKDTVYDDTNIKRRLQTLETKPDKDSQTLSLDGRTLSISDGNYVTLPEDRDTVYNDSELVRRLNALENKTDKFVSGASVTREGSKIVITYTFSTGENKVIEFEDHDTLGVAYDDTAIIERIKALETKPDNDTVYDDSEIKNRLTRLESKKDNDTIYNDSELRGKIEDLSSKETAVESRVSQLEKRPVASNYDDSNILRRLSTLESRNDNDNQTLSLDSRTRALSISNGNSIPLPNDTQHITKQGNKLILSNGGGEVELPQPNNVVPYDDTNLKSRVKTLEDRTDNDRQTLSLNANNGVLSISGGNSVTIPKEPVHRFYNGDIPGAGNPTDIKTVSKNNFRNPDGIKAGDTLEDFATDSNSVSRGIWKVLEVEGDNVKVQGIGNYFTNLRKNLTLDPNTRVLSIDGGNNVTLPNDKQTISKSGNKIILSNGGEVDLSKYDTPEYRLSNSNINSSPNDIVGTKITIDKSSILNNDNTKVGDVVQDYSISGIDEYIHLYRVVSINDNEVTIQKLDKLKLGSKTYTQNVYSQNPRISNFVVTINTFSSFPVDVDIRSINPKSGLVNYAHLYISPIIGNYYVRENNYIFNVHRVDNSITISGYPQRNITTLNVNLTSCVNIPSRSIVLNTNNADTNNYDILDNKLK